MKTTKQLLTILVALLVATSTFATEYTKAEFEEYYFKQVQSVVYQNPSYIRFQKNEATALRISGVLHDKKPVTNEQLKAYDAINKKFRKWHREYAQELQTTQKAWEGSLDAFAEGKAEPTNEQELKVLIDEFVQMTNKFFNDIGPIVDKYGKEIDKIDKMTKTYERM